MPDDSSKRGAADRRKVAAGEVHEVSYFAKKHAITKEQTLELIKRYGNVRKSLDTTAEKLGKKYNTKSKAPLKSVWRQGER